MPRGRQSSMTDPAASYRPEMSAIPRRGCPLSDLRDKLRRVGLRPTRQRVSLGWLLFGKGDRHITAEMLFEEAGRARVPVSLATVYNTLHQFTEAGLLRQLAVDGTKAYFDTNPTEHHHFFLEEEGELIDMPSEGVSVGDLPAAAARHGSGRRRGDRAPEEGLRDRGLGPLRSPGRGGDLAATLSASVINVGIAAGSLVGGFVLARDGAAAVALAAMGVWRPRPAGHMGHAAPRKRSRRVSGGRGRAPDLQGPASDRTRSAARCPQRTSPNPITAKEIRKPATM